MLNANTIIDAYPITCIDDILNRLGGSVIFSKIDLAQVIVAFCTLRIVTTQVSAKTKLTKDHQS